ncbi:MAG: hypothetical protein Roseis2KO_35020 [Roseivirga sp.]
MNFKEIIQHLKTAISSAFSRISKKSTRGKGVEIKDEPVLVDSHVPVQVSTHSIITNTDTFCDIRYWEHQVLFEQPYPGKPVHKNTSVIFRAKVRLPQWNPRVTNIRFGRISIK